jgi:hypothetical protein
MAEVIMSDNFQQLLSSLEKEEDDRAQTTVIQMIKEGKGDSVLPQLLDYPNVAIRVAAQKRDCWLVRRK